MSGISAQQLAGPDPSGHRAPAADLRGAAGDPRVCMWDFYLASCEAAFRSGLLMVFQIQVAKNLRAAPLTRDYMSAATNATEAPAVAPLKRRARGKSRLQAAPWTQLG